jgi:cyclopropane fatty-acyl-phospholipid synthase-like methyltransferase
MLATKTAYTEQDVETFFDQTLGNYLNFWDSEGVLHTGTFTSDDDEDYRAAAERTSVVLASEAKITTSSYVLDVGCGCGNFLIFLVERFGCRGKGLDLSQERVSFASKRLADEKPQLFNNIAFQHGSVTKLPYDAGTFTHVVSQDALFLVPDKPASHAEIFRVLRPGGIFAFCDFLQPKEEISPRGRMHVYDRVRWNSGYSLLGYQAALQDAGFDILLARNLESHIKQTYRVLGKVAQKRAGTVTNNAASDWIAAFATSCGEIELAIDRGEFSWGMFVARKPNNAAKQ